MEGEQQFSNDAEREKKMQELESLKAEAKKAAEEALKLIETTGKVNNPEAQKAYELNQKIWKLEAELGIKSE